MTARRTLVLGVAGVLQLGPIAVSRPQEASSETIEISATATGRPFPHFWERMFGSGRAILSLRESYRRDLRQVHDITGFEYVRFHAILHDETGIYDETGDGTPVYNFSYIDQIYDGLLENGVRPFVELSFMPRKLAARPDLHPFWYHPTVSPPKDWGKWRDLVFHFTRHLVDRYGIDEVSRWYFEVWNEPNIDFWSGDPKEETYYQLYDTAVAGIKQVSPRLRVGGPATAQAGWVDRFIRYCVESHVPVDFVSTHVYGNDSVEDVFGADAPGKTAAIPSNGMVCRAAQKVHDQVKASALPDLPIIWSEYNATYKNEPEITDALFMAPWLANTIRLCDGLTDMMSYWTFSDVFEEQGVVKQPFYGGYGLIAAPGLPKPAFNAFKLLHRLGDVRLPVASDSALATKRSDGTLVIALWNLVPAGQAGPSKEITLLVRELGSRPTASIWRLDATHGSLLSAYGAMGRPPNPTRLQVEELRRAAETPAPETVTVSGGMFRVTVPSEGLVLLEVR
jgi:xylan 1,4-beta-xylosidase